MQTLANLAQALSSGQVRARALVEQALERIADASGEGSRAFMTVATEAARARADEIDRKRAAGQALPAFAGTLPVHRQGDAPVGLMLIGRRGADERLLAIAGAIEHSMANTI